MTAIGEAAEAAEMIPQRQRCANLPDAGTSARTFGLHMLTDALAIVQAQAQALALLQQQQLQKQLLQQQLLLQQQVCT